MSKLKQVITTHPLAGATGLFILWFLSGIVRSYWTEFWIELVFISAFLFNAIAFWFGYSLLRPLNTLRIWKALLYLITVTGTNWFLAMLQQWKWSILWTREHDRLYAALPFLVFVPLTLWFLRYVFGIKDSRVIAVGVLLGMIGINSMIVSIIVYR